MLQRVTMQGIDMPRLYMAENNDDVRLAKENGLPYIKWRHGMDELLRQLLRPALEKMFPGIKWNDVLGKRTPVRSKVFKVSEYHAELPDEINVDYDADKMLDAQYEEDKMSDSIPRYKGDDVIERSVDIAVDERTLTDSGAKYGSYEVEQYDMVSIEDYVGDLSSSVDIDVLQHLGLLPQFVGDVVDCIRFNLSQNMSWTEGYTKKLGVPLGNFRNKKVLPNLLIIDVSHSIPDGIAATMLTLADTLRSQCNAEMIITSARSGYYPVGAELPKPQTLRDYYGRSNESVEFLEIINKYIAGREFGNVISFGDNDSPQPTITRFGELEGTKVHAVYHYHTWKPCKNTGYAEWVHVVNPYVEAHYDTSWCNIMDKRYKM